MSWMPGHVEHGAAHLGGAPDGLLDRVDAGDAADEELLPRLRPHG